MNNIDLVKNNQAMIKSGALTIHNPMWDKIKAKLEHMRIRAGTPLPEMKHLLNINGVNCFPRGDLVAISGKEKCGKTTDCRIIVSALMKGEYMGVTALEKNVCVLWIDTEQASQTSRAVCRGIEMMCGFEPSDVRFVYFALREYPDRQEMTEAMRMLFNEYCPDIAIVDGIRDFIPDFNDVVESAEIVLECMRLSSGVSAEQARKKGLTERPPCCVCCILHQNKPKDDNNMRGHLGTELSNKAGEVWEATQDDDHVFSFAQTRSRTRPVDTPLRYKVVSRNYVDIENQKSEEIGIPQLWEPTEADAEEEVEKVKNFQTSFGWKPLTQDTADRMFYTIMGYADWNFNKLKAKFCEYWGVSYPMFGKLYSMTDHHVFDVMVNGVKFYRYNGPKFD
jgi:hypothetical protein